MRRSFEAAGLVAILLGCLAGGAGSAQAQQYNWSGIYVGVEGGGARGSSDWNNTNHTNDEGDHPSFQMAEIDFAGSVLGGHLGYRHQGGGLVFGIEGAWNRTLLGGSKAINSDTASAAISSISTINGQVGVANDRWLAYATGGFAFASVTARKAGECFNEDGSSCGTFLNQGGINRAGWNAGIGLSYAFSNSLVAGLEYQYVDLGSFDVRALCEGGGCFDTINVHPQIDIVKARLSLKLGGQ